MASASKCWFFSLQMRPLLAEGAAVDPSLGDKYNTECMWKIAELGMMSVKPKAFNRPTSARNFNDNCH